MRFLVTGTRTFLFLNWNLFLAFIPWFISSLIIVKRVKNRIPLLILVFSWLLFFPNSPYILTDLFHLRSTNQAPVWFDLILILSFAWTGLVYGFISLMDIEDLLEAFFRKGISTLMSILFLFLGAFGVYLGRYQRWNSWDLIRRSNPLCQDIIEKFASPADHPRTWGMTVLLGLLLVMMYFTFKLFRSGYPKQR
jgi:uncharacterized membrane protein